MSEVLPKTGFQSPYDVPTPAGAEGWEEMYPYYLLFDPARREEEEKRFWFYNGMHFPEPMPAFDMITGGSCYQSIGLYQGRVFSIPTVLGIEHRVVNGYVYITSNEVTDPAEIEKRLEVFLPRIGFYYANWDSLVNRWQAEVDKRIEELTALEVPKLPELEDEQEVIHDHKLGSNYRLMRSYDRTLQLYNELNQLHFELLLLAYGAYLTFFQFCQGAFPDMGMQTMTQMIAGYDTTMFRPDDELKALARSALDKHVDGAFTDGRSHEEILAELSESEAGREWIADLESRQHPWFYMSTGDGFYHHHRAWADDPRLPFAAIGGYIRQLGEGRSLDRPKEQLLAERDRIASEYSALLPTDEERVQFDEMLGLCRHVFPHAEGHKFFIEHWGTSLFFNKMREIGQVFVDQGFFEEADDVFFLNIHEVHEALFDLGLAWSGGSAGPGNPVLAAAGGTAEGDPRQARRVEPATRARHGAGGDQRPDRAAALGHHCRQAARLGRHGRRRRRRRRRERLRGLAGSRGRRRPRRQERRRHRHRAAGRDPRLLGHCSELGACLPEDRGRRLRHRRDDVSRGDRRPRVRPASRCRHRQRNLDDQDRRPGARRRQHRHGDDPELMTTSRFTIPFDELSLDQVELVGGKSAHLGDLLRAGFPVPPGFAITAARVRPRPPAGRRPSSTAGP